METYMGRTTELEKPEAGKRSELLYAQEGEKVYGDFEKVQPYKESLVALKQVRKDKNKELENLKDSIELQGLYNPIDVAPVSRELLEEYIAFTNSVWGADQSIDDFEGKAIDGMYYLVCAGHSRLEAITQLEDEGRVEPGRITAKIHEVTSIQEILQIQVDENLHSQPPIERVAFVMVEAYLWGVKQGDWSSPEEYAEIKGMGNKQSRIVTDALDFMNLDYHQRQFVMEGYLPYTVGIEAGRTMSKLKEKYAVQMDYSDDDLQKTLEDFPEGMDEKDLPASRVHQLAYEQIYIRINRVASDKLNSTAGKKVFSSWRGRLQKEITAIKQMRDGKKTPQDSLDVDWSFVDPDQEFARLQRENEKAIQAYMRRHGSAPVNHALGLAALNVSFVGNEAVSETMKDLVDSSERAKKIVTELGGASRPATISLFDDALEVDSAEAVA